MFHAPRGGVYGMDLLCGRLEGGHRSAFVPPLCQRIATRARDLSEPHRFLACLPEWHERDATKSEVAPFPLDDGTQDPALGSARRDDELQSTTIADAFGCGPCPVPPARLER